MHTTPCKPGFTRRTLLKGALGLVPATCLPAAVSAEPPERAVWRDLTQDELDAAYDQGRWAPNLDEVWERYAINSERIRARLGEPEKFQYGGSADETLDVYIAQGSNLPIQVFVHGGAWFTGDSTRHGFLAETFVGAKSHFVAVNYSSVDDTDGSLLPLADQVKRAINWIFQNANRFDGDDQRIHVSGHSAGAHLAAVALTTDWQREFGIQNDLIKGGLLCSGIFDLEPVSLSSRNNYVRFDAETVRALSPQRHLANLVSPTIVAYGTLESPEFQRQSSDFASAARESGNKVDLIVAKNYNHFEILETLANPYGVLGFAALRQMGLN